MADTFRKECNFLVLHYLHSLYPDIAEQLECRLRESNALPVRTDWEGREHILSYEELSDRYAYIAHDHLIALLRRFVEIGEPGPYKAPITGRLLVQGEASLLPKAQQAVVKLPEEIVHLKSVLNEPKNKNAMDVDNAEGTDQVPSLHRKTAAVKSLAPVRKLTTNTLLVEKSVCIPFASALLHRELGCKIPPALSPPQLVYSRFRQLKQLRGHTLAIYRVIFDRAGNRIITGSDEYLVKVWSVYTGLALNTIRGHGGDITDLSVDHTNKLLATSANDAVVRVWHLQTCAPAAVLTGHTEAISNVAFCPKPGPLTLLTVSRVDGVMRLWTLTESEDNSETYKTDCVIGEIGAELATSGCVAWSPGGALIAAGDKAGNVQIWSHTPFTRTHMLFGHKEPILCVMWSHSGTRLMTSSRDGTVRIWDYSPGKVFERPGQWINSVTINLTRDRHKCKATSVAWSLNDDIVFIAAHIGDSYLRAYSAKTGQFLYDLMGHSDEVHVLEVHPFDPNLIVSGGDDGRVIFWDLRSTRPIHIFMLESENSAHDGCFSPSGDLFVVSDGEGYITLYGTGHGENYANAPKEQFFKTDYNHFIRDANNFIVDQNTQLPPHLMPRGEYCDVNLNPYENQPKNVAYIDTRGYDKYVLARDTARRQALWEREVALFAPTAAPPESTRPNNVAPAAPPQPRSSRSRNYVRVPAVTPHSSTLGSSVIDTDHLSDDGEYGGTLRRRRLFRRSTLEALRNLGRPPRLRNRPLRTTRADFLAILSEMSETNALSEEELGLPSNVATLSSTTRRRLRRASDEAVAEPELADTSVSGDDEYNQPDYEFSDESEEDEDFTGSSELDEEEEDDLLKDNDSSEQKESRGRRRTRTRRASRASYESDDQQMEEERQSDEEWEKIFQQQESAPRSKPKKRYPEWVAGTDPQFCYVPQLGDKVVLFKTGHRRYAEGFAPAMEDVIPEEVPDVAFCVVKWLEYVLQPVIHCLVHLELLATQPAITTLKTTDSDECIILPERTVQPIEFQVHYHKSADSPDFLVLASRFEKAMKTVWHNGKKILAWMYDAKSKREGAGKWYKGVIVDIQRGALPPSVHGTSTASTADADKAGANSAGASLQQPAQTEDGWHPSPSSLWECLLVTWADSTTEEPTPVSPWEIEETDDDYNLQPLMVECIEPAAAAELADEINKTCEDLGPRITELFMKPVSLAEWPTYIDRVPYPSDVGSICKRLTSNYYRTVEHIVFDLKRIEENSKLFNGSESQVTINSQILVEELLQLLRNKADTLTVTFAPRTLREDQRPDVRDRRTPKTKATSTTSATTKPTEEKQSYEISSESMEEFASFDDEDEGEVEDEDEDEFSMDDMDDDEDEEDGEFNGEHRSRRRLRKARSSTRSRRSTRSSTRRSRRTPAVPLRRSERQAARMNSMDSSEGPALRRSTRLRRQRVDITSLDDSEEDPELQPPPSKRTRSATARDRNKG